MTERTVGEEVITKRGFLNLALGIMTLGRYGVETTTIYGFLNDANGKYIDPSVPPAVTAYQTGEMVIINDIQKTLHVKRKVVKNKA